jgi:hypothetical protein
MARVCRHCGARLSSYFGAGEACWYCHRSLDGCDIVEGREKIEPQSPGEERPQPAPATGAGRAAASRGQGSNWLDRLSSWLYPDWVDKTIGGFTPLGRLGCLGAVIALLLAVGIGLDALEEAKDAKRFREMTPATHLTQARDEFRGGIFNLALRHLQAIPSSAPEGPAARQMEPEVRAAQQSYEAARAAAQQAEAAAKLAKDTAVRDLQKSLTNLGYDLAVTRSDVDDEIVITSEDFGETDHRVRFLSFLRSERSPAFGVCLAGFRTVRLKTKWSLLTGHSEAYALDCR